MTEQLTRYRYTWKDADGGTYDTVYWRGTPEDAESDLQSLKKFASLSTSVEMPDFIDLAVETKTITATDWPNNGTVTVYLEEEYGYRYWLWHTGMQPFELVKWWTHLQSVMDYFHTPEGLPGVVVPCDWADDMIHTFDPSEPFGQNEDGEWFGTPLSYRRPTESRNHWRVHLHCDDDSALMRGFADDREIFKHAGFDNTTLEELESQDNSNG